MANKIYLSDKEALKHSITTYKPWLPWKEGNKDPPTVRCVLSGYRGKWGEVRSPTPAMLEAQAKYDADEKRIKDEQTGPNYERKIRNELKRIEISKERIKKWAKLGNIELDED